MFTTEEQHGTDAAEALADKERLLAEKDAMIVQLRERIRLLEKALFGPRSERIVEVGNQLEFEAMLKELEQLSDELEDSENDPEPPAPRTPSRKRRRRRSLEELIPDDLPEEQIVIDLSDEEKIDPKTGEEMVKVGEERVVKLGVTPANYKRVVFVYFKYAVPGEALSGVKQAPAPDFAIPGGVYDESFLASVVFDKCAMHLPLYRQAERLNNLCIDTNRQTLSHLYIETAEVLTPLYDIMKEQIISRGVIFTDDTPVRLQVKGKGKTVTGRMWVYVGGGTGPPYRVFEFTRDRSKKRPKEFLKGFQGYIHADAYQGYDDLFDLDGVYECGCWMHVRRKFVEAVDAPEELREEILRLIRLMYRYERVLKDKPDEVVVAVRQERTAQVIDTIFERTARALTEGQVLPQSSFAKAIGYMHNLGDALRTFLSDARLKPDNGESERAIRPLSIGRKNWLFAGSKRGGDATGVLLSLIQSCRVMDIDPQVYLEDVLRRINGHPYNRISELLPGNWRKADSYY